MARILVTGASGFIGKAFSAALAARHEVICMSRKSPGLILPWARGSFGSLDDLRRLDRYRIDAVVHLAAVTGGCSERDGILVNVEGTRCLMRYLIDRGCRKFVMASSIAAVGFQSPAFRPLQLPIGDEHPCLDRDGYGLSKYLMEEITRYCRRRDEQIDVINLRLAAICADENMPQPRKVCPLGPWALGSITIMALSDAVRAFALAAEAPYKPGVRIMNAAAPRAWVADPVADILENWYGDAIDLSHFRRPGQEYDSVFDVGRIKDQLGFVAERLS
jgi:UDP-glucose 4-epimerase